MVWGRLCCWNILYKVTSAPIKTEGGVERLGLKAYSFSYDVSDHVPVCPSPVLNLLFMWTNS